MKRTSFFRVKQPYLPQFSRIFTERPIFLGISGLLCGAAASFLLWSPAVHNEALSRIKSLNPASIKEKADLLRSYDEWKRIVEEKPEYRDGFVMLAWYAKELGKTDEEKTYLQKVKNLDPNYALPEVLQIEK